MFPLKNIVNYFGVFTDFQLEGTMTESAEANTQDEIDKIMSEIEELQGEMSTAASAPAPSSRAPATPVPPAKVAQNPPARTAEAAAPAPASLDDGLGLFKDFSGEGDEPWLEETLAHLKSDPEIQGHGILDEAQEENLNATSIPEEAEEMVINSEIHDHSDVSETELSEAETDMESGLEPGMESGTEMDEMASSAVGMLSMGIKGKMSLKFDYASGNSLVIHFGTDSVSIEISDGTEFKVPIRKKALRRAA